MSKFDLTKLWEVPKGEGWNPPPSWGFEALKKIDDQVWYFYYGHVIIFRKMLIFYRICHTYTYFKLIMISLGDVIIFD